MEKEEALALRGNHVVVEKNTWGPFELHVEGVKILVSLDSESNERCHWNGPSLRAGFCNTNMKSFLTQINITH